MDHLEVTPPDDNIHPPPLNSAINPSPFFLAHRSKGLIHDSRGDFQAGGASQTSGPFLQLSACPPRGEGGLHRRLSGSCASSSELLHRAPSRSVGCAPVDGHPAVGAALHLPPLASQKPSEIPAKMLRLSPKSQKNNAFFTALLVSQLAVQGAALRSRQALGARAVSFDAHNSKLAHDVGAAVACFSVRFRRR
jgi:hypothetical protein